MRKCLGCALVFLLVVGSGAGWFWWVERGDWVVKVNGAPVTRARLEAEVDRTVKLLSRLYGIDLDKPQYSNLRAKVERETLERLTDRLLLLQAARRLGIVVTEEEVAARVAADVARSGGAREFQRLLNMRGMTRADYAAEVQQLLASEKLWEKVTAGVRVEPGEVRAAYERRKAEFFRPERRLVAHIFVRSRERAETLAAALARGADFRALAREYSEDAGTRASGGVLGYITRDDPRLPEALRAAAFSLPVGGYTRQPVASEFGYHLVAVLGRKEAGWVPYQEVRPQLEKELLAAKKNAAFEDFLKALRAEARVFRRI